MQYMDNGEHRLKMLKALVEVMATSITGLNSQLDVEFGEHKINNAGEVHHTPTGVTRAVSEPTFVWPEKEGKAIYNFLNQWITDLIMDPETRHPRLITKAAWQNAQDSKEFLPDKIAMTVLFIEPSKDLRTVTSAWLCTNMMPKTSGEEVGERVLGDANATVEHSIPFTATTQIGEYVNNLAQEYLNNLAKGGYFPTALAAAYDSEGESVKDLTGDYKDKLKEVSESASSYTPTQPTP
jgi:hypothetical protein